MDGDEKDEGEKWKRWWVKGTKIMMFERKLFFLFPSTPQGIFLQFLKLRLCVYFTVRFLLLRRYFLLILFLLSRHISLFIAFAMVFLLSVRASGEHFVLFFFIIIFFCTLFVVIIFGKWNESFKKRWWNFDRKQLRLGLGLSRSSFLSNRASMLPRRF